VSVEERKPTHPGELLKEDFLPDFDLTVKKLADAVNVSRQTIKITKGTSSDMLCNGIKIRSAIWKFFRVLVKRTDGSRSLGFFPKHTIRKQPNETIKKCIT